jgi:hypothetical protein
MTNKQILEKLDTAIKAAIICESRPHIRLIRYRNTIEKLIRWEHKLRIAQNRVDFYSRRSRIYERSMNYNK